jgi:hypothetical protein
MRPRLEACYFAAPDQPHWPRLARVLAYTAQQHCPDWTVHVEQIPPPPRTNHTASFVANTWKLNHWCRLVEEAADGERLLFIDVDTMILRPIDSIWNEAFDFAYTVRPGNFPFNAGVIFLRVSPSVRNFIRQWRDLNDGYCYQKSQSEAHRANRRKYAGINQAALGALFEQGAARALAVRPLPCAEWNCENTTWATFNPAVTRIVHIKSALRRTALQLAHSGGRELVRLAHRWRAFEADAIAAETRAS